MKKYFAFSFVIFLAACSASADKYAPEKYLSVKEMDANLWAMIRYLGKSPEGLTPPERFYPGYDSHYVEQMKLLTLDAWYKDGEDQYFLVSKRAPSVTEKRVATGGKVVFDENGKVSEYEEVFRTWKLVPDTLKKRSMILFDKMVQGENLKPFETKYSNGIEFIEFPDEVTFYDKSERTWKLKSQN
jgi:hypothetical protein